ncbi:hypothetical protein SMKI_07G0390 [Saccharomyces mikatae IFO 1815]|uniref:Uncharacterized protein n=1 Tax=Saccharomyces mikatae IFO 1815 TaxID=226126 RepID=A0AA35IZI0_SACMI|nr:uncharacterized protein SMKI_07G0390 [Saccharomyces mikatae IFO 1815]CAI4039072.1 hypothetical protein SMKI_07G0390 [Saccharomyces mikatae IFO 1815]
MDEVIPLFREFHIAQIKDYQLELHNDLIKTNEAFQKNLLNNYKRILSLTDSVNDLSLNLKSVDQDFKSLCFDDEKFQLNKLPTLLHQSTTHISPTCSGVSVSLPSQNILVISNWTISIDNFCNRIATSTTPSRIFDEMLLRFHELSLISVPHNFETLIKKRCFQLQKFLVESMTTLNLTLLQWVKLYNLLNAESSLRWDGDLLSEFNESLFETLFNENVQALLGSNINNKKHQYYPNEQDSDTIILDFVSSSTFKDHLIRRTVKEINTHLDTLTILITKLKKPDTLHQLDVFFDNDENVDHNTVSPLDEDTLKKYIDTALYCSKGLSNDTTLQIYQTVQPTIEILQNLEMYGCPQELLTDLKEKLVTQLQDFKTEIETCLSPSLENSMNIVENFMASYNNHNLLQLVIDQITQLRQ